MKAVSLIVLRTLVGWHFAYEGYYKLAAPAWAPGGGRIAPFSAEGYLRSATGPLAGLFHSMSANPSIVHATDVIVPIALLMVGLSLMLGLFTQTGCVGAMLFLALFYVSQPPLSGMPQTGAEGAYLIVNKNLIEMAAVMTVMVFRTGAIAGLDCLWPARRGTSLAVADRSRGDPMPDARTIQRCRWAEPTLFLAHPLWAAAEEYPWSCRTDGTPQTVDDTANCRTCARWELRDAHSRRDPGTFRKD